MDKKDIFKKNVLKRLYGSSPVRTETEAEHERTSEEVVDEKGTDIRVQTTLTPPRVFGAERPPADYTYRAVQDCQRSSLSYVSIEGENSSSDSSDDTETKTQKSGRRRKNKHRKMAEEPSNPYEDVKVSDKTIGKTLTKNQRRKLKKRRKAKERAETTGREFIHNANKEEPVVQTGKNVESRESKSIEGVLEFFDGIWDVYQIEGRMKDDVSYHNEKTDAFTSAKSAMVNVKDQDTLVSLNNLKTFLVLNDTRRANEAILQFQERGKMEGCVVDILCELMYYWLNCIMSTN